MDSEKAKEATYVIAYKGSTPLGCGAYRSFGDGAAEIKRFYVCKKHMGQGVAVHILTFLEESARADGFCYMRLETGPNQPEAIRLYHKFGYADIPLFGEYLESGGNYSIYMEKNLTEHTL